MGSAELLSPAGNLERLQIALHYGADAVYVGARQLSLRNYADNFGPEELRQGCGLAHAAGKKVYVALNAFARDEDFNALPALLSAVAEAGADALIVNDPGILRAVRRTLPDLPLHLSTQANTLNSEAATFWYEQGIKRIVLARELSIEQIAGLRAKTPSGLELEAFVHGAMCMAYSGRCLLSNYIAGRDSNRGECAQPCRWAYELRERGAQGEYFSIEQGAEGSFVFNARDLRLMEYLPALLRAGVCSCKIEGRMKSDAYVATVTNAYRMALDAYAGASARGEADYTLPGALLRELDKVSHRPYTTGFALGKPPENIQYTHSAGNITQADIAAIVLGYDAAGKVARVSQRNKFADGDMLHILAPGDIGRAFRIAGIKTREGAAMESAPHPMEELYIGCAEPVQAGDILRIERGG
ncbi:MAG: U32 family peptidase [Christensenellaceae bacterium]|jgi:putative protease|nr:U32 family peptidase [Christensenellaceae bacterium]